MIQNSDVLFFYGISWKDFLIQLVAIFYLCLSRVLFILRYFNAALILIPQGGRTYPMSECVVTVTNEFWDEG